MRNHRTLPVRNEAFALLELLLVVVVIGMLLAVWSASLNRVREKTWITLDLANFRQILKASAIYNSDNNDYMAHPTWGLEDGPDGWAYITHNLGRLPGAPVRILSCTGRDLNSREFTNQLAFFSKGQVTQYLDDGVKTTWCPKDVAYREARHGSRARQLWLARSVKVTSYAWNGTVGGYVGPKRTDLKGKTYKVSQFRPSDWLMWEPDDSDAFRFNDGAENPEPLLISRRHSGQQEWWRTTSFGPRSLPGGAVVGAIGGTAHYVRWAKVWDLGTRKIGAPNEILNGPGYQ